MALTGKRAVPQGTERVRSDILRLPASRTAPPVLLIAVLIFISGCPPAGDAPARIPETGPDKIEPNVAEPGVTELPPEPNAVEPAVGEPEAVEPNVAGEPNLAEPNVAEVNLPEPNQAKPPPRVSFHDKCALILTTFVDHKGMVNYEKLKHKGPELAALLDEFAKLDRKQYNSWPKEDKIALWINAYNIQMLKVITENYPIESSRIDRFFWPPTSIRHIPPTDRVGVSKWDKYKLLVMDEEFTLSAIEQRFFFEKFEEPRVFFAITHASLSGPLLRNEPYYGYKLSEQLDDQARKFLSRPRAFKIERDKQRVNISVILQPRWCGQEFIARYGIDRKFKDHAPATRAVLNFITKYVSEQDVLFLERESYSIRYIRYDWRLNDGSANNE
jgi:hypothetical protein